MVSVEGRNFCRVFQVARNRIVRSGYVPFGNEANERERREVARIRSVTEECEDKSTEPSQYYEYGEDASRREERRLLFSLFFSFHK